MRELSVYMWSVVGERLALNAISLRFLKVKGVLHGMKKVQNCGDPTCGGYETTDREENKGRHSLGSAEFMR